MSVISIYRLEFVRFNECYDNPNTIRCIHMTSLRSLDQLNIATAVGCAICGGVFFAFSTFVMPALVRMPAAEGAAAMQSINVKAPNPLFMFALFGSAIGCIVLAVFGRGDLPDQRGMFRVAAAGVFLVGIVLTVAYHVPKNNALATLDPRAIDTALLWKAYATSWTRWNHLRAATSIAASTLLIVAARA